MLDPAIENLELYEFCYALDNLTPTEGWGTIHPEGMDVLLERIHQEDYFTRIQLKPLKNGKVILDDAVISLTRTLFTGIVNGCFPLDWVDLHFYFDVRAFLFFIRTQYHSPEIQHRLSGKPYLSFTSRQTDLLREHEIGYKDLREANREIDTALINLLITIIQASSNRIVFSLIGPSGAGKTEITQRLRVEIQRLGKTFTSIELDNFLKDGEYRDGMALSQDMIHFELFKNAITQLKAGKTVSIPSYDFLKKRSSHNLAGAHRKGSTLLQIDPAEVIFLEGNFPMHIPEIAALAGIKIVYLADDPIRLKRKWHRDIDLRKKYEPVYFCNRFFRTQHLRAAEIIRPMLRVCDFLADTTRAELWITPAIQVLIAADREDPATRRGDQEDA